MVTTGFCTIWNMIKLYHDTAVVQKSRQESAHAQNYQFKIPTKRARMRGFSSRFLDNQPENCCTVNCKSHVSCKGSQS